MDRGDRTPCPFPSKKRHGKPLDLPCPYSSSPEQYTIIKELLTKKYYHGNFALSRKIIGISLEK
jgi:hypothetical protein